MKMNTVTGFTLGVLLILVNFTGCYAELKHGFYNGPDQCNFNVENTVQRIVSERIANDRTLVAALVRMQFHDCFVEGCDASILIEGADTEKTAAPNGSVREYQLIDDIKAELEKSCANKVSCADIIAMAARDSIALSQGKRYEVRTGRKDGFVSHAADAVANLPSPSISVSNAINVFANKGLNATDMVLLLGGGHTMGKASCGNFEDRLAPQDPSMDEIFAEKLKGICPISTKGKNAGTADLDQNPSSTNIVDNSIYNQIRMKKGLLSIDQRIAFDPSTSDLVRSLSNDNTEFLTRFGEAMIKMGEIGVKLDSNGEIRKDCKISSKQSQSTPPPSPPMEGVPKPAILGGGM